jgi:hypothetical protein
MNRRDFSIQHTLIIPDIAFANILRYFFTNLGLCHVCSINSFLYEFIANFLNPDTAVVKAQFFMLDQVFPGVIMVLCIL